MLKQPLPSPARWFGGLATVLSLALLAGVGAWAAQPDVKAETSEVPAGKIRIHLSARIDGGDAKPPIIMLKNSGELFGFEVDENGHVWELRGSSRMLENGQLLFSSVVSKDGTKVANPSMLVVGGEPASFSIGEQSDDGSFQGLQLDVLLEGVAGTQSNIPGNKFVPIDAIIDMPVGEALVPPAYPSDAAKRGIGGRVVLIVDVDESGHPTNVVVEESNPAGVFDQAAVAAARNWSFKPAMEDGRAVPSQVRVPVDFKADEPKADIPTVNQYPAS